MYEVRPQIDIDRRDSCQLGLPRPIHSQERIKRGPWKLFRQEQPPLSYDEIQQPFIVRKLSGSISDRNGKALTGADFEIGLAGGQVLSTSTGKEGRFELQAFGFGLFAHAEALPEG